MIAIKTITKSVAESFMLPTLGALRLDFENWHTAHHRLITINSLFARPRACCAYREVPALSALVADVKVNLGIVSFIAVHIVSSWNLVVVVVVVIRRQSGMT